MSSIVNSFFTDGGNPATGLSPTIRIWEITSTVDTLVITDAAMTEVGDGFYKYEFTEANGFDTDATYVLRTDGGAGLTSTERYGVGEIADVELTDAEKDEIVDRVWDETVTDHTLPDSTGLTLQQINTNTSQTLLNTQQLLIDVADLDDLVDLVRKYDTNRTKIFGDPRYELVVYDDDCTTELRVFKLYDSSGQPSIEEVCERRPENASDGQPVCS